MTQPQPEPQFNERLWSDPRRTSKPASADLVPQWQAAQDFESRLESVMQGPVPSPELHQRLLGLTAAEDERLTTPVVTAANDSLFWYRILPTAALLILTIGMGWHYNVDQNLQLEQDIFGHVYAEEPYMPEGRHYNLAEVNAHLAAAIGAHLAVSPETENLQVVFLKDCMVAKQLGTHLVMQGSKGPVNIIVLPGSVVDNEIQINDERFSGLVSPASGRTLVVIGNKQETIAEYQNLLNSSLEWEY